MAEMIQQQGKVVVKATAQMDDVFFNPLTGQMTEEQQPLFQVIEVNGDAGDPFLEYTGFRREYVRNLALINRLEIALLRQQGVEVVTCDEANQLSS